jgi:hypothetical protein
MKAMKITFQTARKYSAEFNYCTCTYFSGILILVPFAPEIIALIQVLHYNFLLFAILNT